MTNAPRGERTSHAPPPGVGLRIEIVDPIADPRWDDYVTGHPNATVYHRAAWFESLRREYPSAGHALLCSDADGTVQGVLPLIETRGLPLGLGAESVGRRLSSLPRTPFAGPLTSTEAALEQLARTAAERAAKFGARLQIKAAGQSLAGVVDGLRGTVWRTSHVVTLPVRGEELRFGDARNHSTIRRAVRKAERAGLVTRDAETEAELHAWYRLYLELCRYRGQPARAYRFFHALWKLLRPAGLMRLLIAELSGGGGATIMAGNVLLLDGQTMTYGFNGRSDASLALRPNDLLHWAAMHDAVDAGYRRYDLGEVSDSNAGLARFKAKWGGTVEHTFRYHLPPVADDGAAYGMLDSPGRLRRLLLAGWQRVPLRVTAFVGRRIYGYL